MTVISHTDAPEIPRFPVVGSEQMRDHGCFNTVKESTLRERLGSALATAERTRDRLYQHNEAVGIALFGADPEPPNANVRPDLPGRTESLAGQIADLISVLDECETLAEKALEVARNRF